MRRPRADWRRRRSSCFAPSPPPRSVPSYRAVASLASRLPEAADTIDAFVVADDLTGAADTGVQFSRVGLATRVWLRLPSRFGDGVTAVDADTRSATATLA